MKKHLAHVAIVVKDYDEAIDFYTKKLNFIVKEDTRLSESKRWVLIAPSAENECSILLAKAANEEQKKFIGNQSGGRVFLFLHTDNFQRDYESFLSEGIEFVTAPLEEIYGMVAVFKDIYGNLWDLIEPKNMESDANQSIH